MESVEAFLSALVYLKREGKELTAAGYERPTGEGRSGVTRPEGAGKKDFIF